MIDKKKLKALFSQELRAAGFTAKAGSWYRDSEETVQVINLQKSNCDDSYFLNLAIWIKQIGECDYPKEQHCHVRIRAGAIAAEQSSDVARLLDFNSSYLYESREPALRTMLTQLVLPFLASASTLDGLRQLLASGTLRNAFVRGNARTILE